MTPATHPAHITRRLRKQLERDLQRAAATLERRHQDLGARIRAARKAKGWKQKELAAAVHVEPVTVSRWERGEHAADIATLQRIASALGVELSDLVTTAPDSDTQASAQDVARLSKQVSELQSRVDSLLDELRQGRAQSG